MARPLVTHVLPLPLLLLVCVSRVLTQPHQQQYFRIKPQPSVEVIQGSTVVLSCTVGNQAGAAQWSKNGFLLGQFSQVSLASRSLSMSAR